MTSEIRANTIKNRVGLGTVSFTNTGPVVSGIVTANTLRLPDSPSGSLGRLQIGNGLDLSLFHDGNNSFLVNNTGYLSIQSQDGVNGIFIQRNAEVNLYFGPSVRLQTSSSGVTINKDLDVDGHANLDNVSIAGVVTATTFVGALTGTASGNTTITGAGNNKIVTSYQNNQLVAESGLTWNGNVFETNGGAETWTMRAQSSGPSSKIGFQNQHLANGYKVGCGADNKSFVVYTNGQNNGERLRIDQIGISTFYQNLFANKDLDVDGHTNLDNVSIAGVTTHNGTTNLYGNGGASVVWGDTGYTGHLSFDASNNAVIRAASGKALIFQTNHVNERLRITSGGNVQLPINGQQLTWGASQQMKFYYESSEERMYLQGDGAYGFAFRVNSGNRIEISKTTGDVTMQGASGRNFLWDNSEASLYLTDNGSGSATLKIGTSGDLKLYHDAANNINFITASTNGEIKISGGVSFYDYTGNTKRAVIDSNGLRIGTVSSPSLPTTGKPPMIMRTETNFTKEVHRTISDYRSVGDGTHGGYLLLIRAWPGTNQSGKKFYGTIMCDRGSTGSGNSTQVARVHASTAYNNDKLIVEVDTLEQYITAASKVTYGGVDYLALKFGSGGGGANHGIHIDGTHRGTDNNFLKLVRDNEVSVVDDYYGSYSTSPAYMPTCAAFVSHMTGSTYDGGVLSSGNVRYQYAPAGQSSPYNNSNGQFTARVSGIYLVTGGVLVETGSGRLEGKLEWYNGSSWQTWVNFNGTGTTYDGPTFTCMIPLKEGYIIRMGRSSGNAYNSSHAQHYFGVHLLNALRRQDVPI